MGSSLFTSLVSWSFGQSASILIHKYFRPAYSCINTAISRKDLGTRHESEFYSVLGVVLNTNRKCEIFLGNSQFNEVGTIE